MAAGASQRPSGGNGTQGSSWHGGYPGGHGTAQGSPSQLDREVDSAFQSFETQVNRSGRSFDQMVSDAAQQLGAPFRDAGSPYIICIPAQTSGKRASGTCLGGGLAFMAAIFLAVSLSMLLSDPAGAGVGLCFTAACGIPGVRLLAKSHSEKRFFDTLQRMDNALVNRESASFAEIAGMVGAPADEVERVSREAIARGLIPEGRIGGPKGDEGLFMTNRAWNEWVAWVQQTGYTGADAPARDAGTGATGQAAGAAAAPSPEVAAFLQTCEGFCADVQEAAAGIQSQQASGQLRRITSRVASLAAYVREHPEAAPRMRRLSTYYLPTARKLALSYVELEKRGDSSQAASTREELENGFALMDDALAKLADELLQEKTWDLKSDVDVMRTMLKQDGLSEDGMR